MRKVIHKWFWAWDFEQEEAWFNQMAAQGLHLVSVGWAKYTFEEGEPGAYVYRMELLDYLPSHPEGEQYIRFMEETGAEQVASYLRWVVFRRPAADGSFDLFSDLDSRLRHLQRIRTMLLPLGVFATMVGGYNFGIGLAFPSPLNLALSFPVFAAGLLCLNGVRNIGKKIAALQQEREIRE